MQGGGRGATAVQQPPQADDPFAMFGKLKWNTLRHSATNCITLHISITLQQTAAHCLFAGWWPLCHVCKAQVMHIGNNKNRQSTNHSEWGGSLALTRVPPPHIQIYSRNWWAFSILKPTKFSPPFGRCFTFCYTSHALKRFILHFIASDPWTGSKTVRIWQTLQ